MRLNPRILFALMVTIACCILFASWRSRQTCSIDIELEQPKLTTINQSLDNVYLIIAIKNTSFCTIKSKEVAYVYLDGGGRYQSLDYQARFSPKSWEWLWWADNRNDEIEIASDISGKLLVQEGYFDNALVSGPVPLSGIPPKGPYKMKDVPPGHYRMYVTLSLMSPDLRVCYYTATSNTIPVDVVGK